MNAKFSHMTAQLTVVSICMGILNLQNVTEFKYVIESCISIEYSGVHLNYIKI